MLKEAEVEGEEEGEVVEEEDSEEDGQDLHPLEDLDLDHGFHHHLQEDLVQEYRDLHGVASIKKVTTTSPITVLLTGKEQSIILLSTGNS